MPTREWPSRAILAPVDENPSPCLTPIRGVPMVAVLRNLSIPV
jgi:hypothetical protein